MSEKKLTFKLRIQDIVCQVDPQTGKAAEYLIAGERIPVNSPRLIAVMYLELNDPICDRIAAVYRRKLYALIRRFDEPGSHISQ